MDSAGSSGQTHAMADRPAPALVDLDPWDGVSVTVRHNNRYVCNPRWGIEPQRLTYSTLFYIESGRGWMQRGDSRLEARPGDLFFNLTGHVCSAGHDPRRPVTVLSVGLELRDAIGADPLHRMNLPDRLAVPARRREALTAAYEAMIAARRPATDVARLAERALGLQLLAAALRALAEAPASARAGRVPPALPSPRFAPVLAHIDAHLERALNLSVLSKLAGLSPAHFAAAFRQAVGQSPMRYVRDRRIAVARQQLARGEFTVEQIAARVGFDDPFHFSRVFRKSTGMAPTQYARAVRARFV
jgi:AraC-like DNA-binding protein